MSLRMCALYSIPYTMLLRHTYAISYCMFLRHNIASPTLCTYAIIQYAPTRYLSVANSHVLSFPGSSIR
eukprot:1112606-Rhodomonas_salina.1